MALRGVAYAVLLLMAVPACWASPSWPAEQIAHDPALDANASVLLENLRPALAGKPARIEYVPLCAPTANALDLVAYPHADTRPPPKDRTGLDAVRAIFRRDRSVTVSGGSVIRIRIGDVPQTLLRIRLARLHLSLDERYNALLALFAILDSDDVKSAMLKLGLRPAPHLLDYLVTPPIPSEPHLPATLRDLTVAQALDMVAKKFRGVVLYAACTQSPMVDVNFVWLGRDLGSNATFDPLRHAEDFRLPPATPP